MSRKSAQRLCDNDMHKTRLIGTRYRQKGAEKQKGRRVADLFFYLGIRAGTSAVAA